MDALVKPRWDRTKERAWASLAILLQTYPEGIASVAAIDRLVEHGLPEREAMEMLDDLRADGRVVLSGGRWQLS
jgi:hypothetical protein